MKRLSWFTGDPSTLARLSARQRSFLHRVDQLLSRLDPPGASRDESWFTAEPNVPADGAMDDGGGNESHTLWICIAPAAARHEALQIGFRERCFIGGWDDRHYAWDRPDTLLEREIRSDDDESAASDEVIEWIEAQLHRPAVIVRTAFRRRWAHADELKRLRSGGPAGFFDAPS